MLYEHHSEQWVECQPQLEFAPVLTMMLIQQNALDTQEALVVSQKS